MRSHVTTARRASRTCVLTVAGFVWTVPAAAQTPARPAPQNPSPMVERTRSHERLPEQAPPGARRSFAGPLDKPVHVFVPAGTRRPTRLRLVIHFHGAASIPDSAVAQLGGDYAAAVVSLGAGSGIYDRAFSDPAVYESLLAGIRREAGRALGTAVGFDRVTLSGFSAGHGAIRAILREPRHFDSVDAVLLLDGLHTGYVPERQVLADGGALDDRVLEVFVRFAKAALSGDKRLLITHSEIFPGTFASTTETSDFLLQALGLRRTAVLEWGPRGMQQLSEVRAGSLMIFGFAGNSAPDHIDHFHGMPEFLRMLEAQ